MGHIRRDERDRLDVFRHHRLGNQAIAQAAIDMLGKVTKVETFAFAEHPNPDLKNPDPGRIHGIRCVRMSMCRLNSKENYLTPFWCSPDGEDYEALLGPGRHSSNLAMVSAHLALGIERERQRAQPHPFPQEKPTHLLVFRITELPENYNPDWWMK